MKIFQLMIAVFLLSTFTLSPPIQAGDIHLVSADTPLLIVNQGSFAVGGDILLRPGTYDNSHFPGWGNSVEAGQSYHASVDFQILAEARELPLVFIHGYGQSARCWQTTPDGRDGFNNIFLRKRYAAYLVDLPGRGRAGRTTAETRIRPLADEQFCFDIFRIGEWPSFFPGVQFPTDKDSLDQFFRQMTPNIGSHDMQKDLDALVALFNRVGQGILVTHSAGGFPGWMTAIRNPKVRAIVSLEPGTYVFPEGEVPADMPSLTGKLKGTAIPRDEFNKLTYIPIILYFGDYIPDNVTDKLGGENWRVRLQMGRKFVEAINRHGGNATLEELPKIGIRGNTHFLMSDKNNDIIANHIAAWFRQNALDK